MKMVLLVEGMSCGHCKKAVEDAVGKLDGVEKVSVDLESKKVEIEGSDLDEKEIKEIIEDAGYDVVDS